MELRFAENERMYQLVYETVRGALSHREMIVQVGVGKDEPQKKRRAERQDPRGRAI